jgi:hypothetical protein
LVVVLAAGAAVLFGALAVTIRVSLGPGIDPEAASFVTAVVALPRLRPDRGRTR